MIVVNRNWLVYLGMPFEVANALEDCPGLMLSSLFGFASGFAGGRYTSALVRQPAPRTLMLLGLDDRAEAARGLASAIIEIGLLGQSFRHPSASERATILEALDGVDHWTARAVAAAVHESAGPPSS